MYIKIKIKEIRERKNIEIKQLQMLTGISRDRICGIEEGEIDPSILEAEKIAKALDVNVEELYEIIE